MENEKLPDISELIQLMFVGLMGANKEINKVLKAFHEKHDKPSDGFLFYEFLAHQPLYKEPPTGSFNKTWIFSPFPHRLARRSLVMTEEEFAKNEILINMDTDQFTQRLYKYWKNKNDKDVNMMNIKGILNLEFMPLETPFIDPQKFYNPFFVKISNYTINKMEKLYDELPATGNIITDNINKKSFKTLKKLRGPLLDDKNEVTSILIPIASSEIFYGDLMVLLPYFKKIEIEEIEYENKLKQLAAELLTYIKKHYVPALALIHEHFFENLISKQKKIGISELMGQYDVWLQNDKIEASYYSPICRRATMDDKQEREKSCYKCDYFGWEESSDNVVEKYLHKLWQDRKTLSEPKYIVESLFFKNRLRTAPEMLEVLESFLKPSKAKLKKDDDLLPSILVVASPGAGKEDVPKLIKLFSDCYNRGKTYKLNMASLKPDAIVPVAMVGGEITLEASSPAWKEAYKLKGILGNIRKDLHDKFKGFLKDLPKKAEDYENKLGVCIKTILVEIGRIISGIEIPNVNIIGNKNIIIGKIEENKTASSERGKNYLEIERGINELKDQIKNIEQQLAKEEQKHIQQSKTKLITINKLIPKLQNVNKLNQRGCTGTFECFAEKLNQLGQDEKLIVKKLYGRFPTIVLDELNSMSIESQGVLLRFLENAEITPIGGYEDEMLVDGEDDKAYREFITDFLVVGLMNEDPEAITREEAIRFLEKEKYIGGLLGDLLYEHILKIRRLRPDLRSRMMRNGIFKMPKLAEHRADIPVIFYGLMDKYKGDYFVNGKIRITMDALEYLMSPEWDWPENVRLLETLTKKVVEIVYEDYEDKEDKLIIVRERHIRKAMKEIGMLKESGICEK